MSRARYGDGMLRPAFTSRLDRICAWLWRRHSWARSFILSFAGSAVAAVTALATGMPWWAQLALGVALIFLASWGLDRWRDRKAEELQEALGQPLVLDEDGGLHVAALLPGEELRVTEVSTPAGAWRVLAAHIVRPDGTVRLSSDWSHR